MASWFASSKTCSCCGHKVDILSLSVRKWTCPVCSAGLDRDTNAAINIRQQGVSN
ncbi:zinc ribbon domain-containing protein [Allopseudospirillum japonicum]|uniref:zinc ribbon domain-containing protein n=1 Tax=Allopseudospirillum japonicum TaxID=64971 RepID=UPI0037BFC314